MVIGTPQKMTGASLIVGSILGIVGNALHPHVASADAAGVVRAIGANGAWVAIHLAVIVGILLIIGGFVGLADQLGTRARNLRSPQRECSAVS